MAELVDECGKYFGVYGDYYFDCDLAYNTKRFCYLTFEEGFLNEIGVESENDVQTIEFEIKVSSSLLIKASLASSTLLVSL
mgnify:CR=1 FL=1